MPIITLQHLATEIDSNCFDIKRYKLLKGGKNSYKQGSAKLQHLQQKCTH